MKVSLATVLVSAALLASPARATLVVSGTGTLDSTDSVQTDRLHRDGIPSTWAAPKSFPGGQFGGGDFHYDLVNATFGPNAVQDVYYEISYTDNDPQPPAQDTSTTPGFFSAAFLNSYDPTNLGVATYLGDAGTSPGMTMPTITYQVVVPAGGQLLVNIMEVFGPPVGSYSYEVNAYSDANRGEEFVTPSVPEPSTWTMMLLGFGALGLATRRRKDRALAQVT